MKPTEPAQSIPRQALPGQGTDRGLSRWPILTALVLCGSWILWSALAPQGFWWQAVARFLPVLAILAAGLLLAVASLRGDMTLPAVFVVREGVGFTVPRYRQYGHHLIGLVLLGSAIVGLSITQWRMPADHHDSPIVPVLYSSMVVMLVLSGLAVAFTTAHIIVALGERPCIELTPDAVLFRDRWGRLDVPWQALRPGLPMRGANLRVLSLTVDQPELVVRHGLIVGPTRQLKMPQFARVNGAFLADVIRYYVDHPQWRPAIGTHAEYARLLAEFGLATRS
jgi:hypothetical protein